MVILSTVAKLGAVVETMIIQAQEGRDPTPEEMEDIKNRRKEAVKRVKELSKRNVDNQ